MILLVSLTTQSQMNTYPTQNLPKSRRGKLPYFVRLTILISKPVKNDTKKNYTRISLMNIDIKTLNNFSRPNPTIHQKDYTTRSRKFILETWGGLTFERSINIILYINKRKDKNHITIINRSRESS